MFLGDIISVEDYVALPDNCDTRGFEELCNNATDWGTCNCGQPVWRLAGCGMCFTCTTGESDSSEDYELQKLTYKQAKDKIAAFRKAKG
jgi:hypothetical protein